MADYSYLIKIIKKVCVDTIKAEKPVTICYGKVINESPLKIQIDQKITLGDTQLVLTEKVTDYEVEVDVDWSTEPGGTYTHSHTVGGKKKMTIHNGLHNGDEVILLRQQGGQRYIVMDRVVKV